MPARAAATVTPAAGGGTISADTSAGAPGQAWTSLGAIMISEGTAGDIDDGVFVLTIPFKRRLCYDVTPAVGRD